MLSFVSPVKNPYVISGHCVSIFLTRSIWSFTRAFIGYKNIALTPTSLLPFSTSDINSFKIGYKKLSVFPDPVPVVIIALRPEQICLILSSWWEYKGLSKFISPNLWNDLHTAPSAIISSKDIPLWNGKFKST